MQAHYKPASCATRRQIQRVFSGASIFMSAYPECAFRKGGEHKVACDTETEIYYRGKTVYTTQPFTSKHTTVGQSRQGLISLRPLESLNLAEVVVDASRCQLPLLLAPLVDTGGYYEKTCSLFD